MDRRTGLQRESPVYLLDVFVFYILSNLRETVFACCVCTTVLSFSYGFSDGFAPSLWQVVQVVYEQLGSQQLLVR